MWIFEIVRRMNSSKLSGYLFFILGVSTFVLGLFVLKDTYYFVEASANAEGEVVSIVNEDGYFYLKVEFRDINNNLASFQSNGGCSPSCYSENEIESVRYIPGKDSEPRIDTFFNLWFPSSLLLVIGCAFVLTSLFQIKRLNRESI